MLSGEGFMITWNWLERLSSYIQDVNSVFELEWADGVKYGDIFKEPEFEHSKNLARKASSLING